MYRKRIWRGKKTTCCGSFYKKSIESCISAPWVDNVVFVDKINPVSGTQIRKNPVKYWSKITAPFKPYLCKNILIIGTASEGKSTLVRDIANYFGSRPHN